MERALTTEEIIFWARANAGQQRWRNLRTAVLALYGPQAHAVTMTILTAQLDDGWQQGAQLLVTDAHHQILPFDLTTAWWQEQSLTRADRASLQAAHLDELLGLSLPDILRATVRAFAEPLLGVEFVEVWQPSPPLTSTFQFAAMPTLPFTSVAGEDATGIRHALNDAEVLAATHAYADYQRWEQARAYATQLYGNDAASMAITIWSIYNDSSYDQRPMFVVSDAQGQRMYYDFTLPWWVRFGFAAEAIAAYETEHPRGAISQDRENSAEDDDPISSLSVEALNLLRRDLLQLELGESWEQQAPDTITFDFAAPPVLPYTRLVVSEDPALVQSSLA